MLVISRLQPGNSESKWVGVLCENQEGKTYTCYQGSCMIKDENYFKK